MELSWTTFVLEIVNFLVLVWILTRFLYRPVLDVIARRQANVEKTLTDARAVHQEADELKSEYENRLTDWESEKALARETLHREIDDERARLQEKLKAELDTGRSKARAVEGQRIKDALARYEEKALTQGAAFAARLLSRLGEEDIHEKLIRLTLEEVSGMSAERKQSIRSAYERRGGPVKITSAYEIPAESKGTLEEQLRSALGDAVAFDYILDKRLRAGLRIVVGPWIMHANLEDELKAFVESAHEPA